MERLPLTRFETFLFHEDRPAYPCWILTRFRFAGSLRREALERAWIRVIGRHPLLGAVVRRRFGRLGWEPAPGPAPAIEWRHEPLRDTWPELAPIDLRREPGVRLIVREDAGAAELFVQPHHAVCDGAGIYAFVDDLLIHYARELGSEIPVARVSADRLRDRNGFGLSLLDKIRLAPVQALGLALAIQLHWRKVTPLLPHCPAPDDSAPPPGLPAMVNLRFSPEEFQALRAAASRLGTGLYDLFIRDIQAALGVWFAEQGSAGPLDWVYLNLPLPLRRPADSDLPATNVVSLAIIDRQVRSLSASKRERLLKRAREDMGLMRRKRLGLVFLILLGLLRLVPGGIRRYCRSRSCRSTFLLSNVGQVFSTSPLLNRQGKLAVPGAVLEDVGIAGPLRPGTCASIVMAVYAGGLWADLHYDPRVLTLAQASSLADAFAAQLRLSIQGR